MAVVMLHAAALPPALHRRAGGASRCARASRCVVAQAKPTPPSGPGGAPKKPAVSRGPGAAPLRMQTDDQRKFGYGGDNYDGGGRGDGDGWQPGGSDDGANPAGLAILVACGLWAYFEYKRPGGKLNPRKAEHDRAVAREQAAAAQAARVRTSTRAAGGGGAAGTRH